MPTHTWGSGGSNKGSYTGVANDGWRTPNLGMPTARAAYNGSRPIAVSAVRANAGTGDRRIRYRYDGSGDLANGYHLVSGGLFEFRVIRNSGTIGLGLHQDGSATTIWIGGGDVVDWYPNGPQPGSMDWQQVPTAPGVPAITPGTDGTSALVWVTASADDGGLGIVAYTHQLATDAGFTNVVRQERTGGTYTFTGLTPGATYYHRVMANNSLSDWAGLAGGEASSTRSFFLGRAPQTAPASLTITPGASGTVATVRATTPTDTGGLVISAYRVEWEYLGPAPAPDPAAFAVESGAATFLQGGLVPGATYRWRAAARNSVGLGPYTAWQTVVQPKPNTDPGDYFDGGYGDTSDLDFAWTGTAHASTSTASGLAVTGWLSFADGAGGSGTTGAVTRATGGLVGAAGTRAAKVVFFTDATAAGFRAGTAHTDPGRAAVVDGGYYWGSLHVYLPGRSQRLAAELVWADDAGAVLGSTIGVGQPVPMGVTTRVAVYGQAPEGATWAAVRVLDATGSGWAAWQGGDVMLLDGAMITLGELFGYFDGDLPDTPFYDYGWEGTPNASVSRRITLAAGAAADALADPDCPPVPAPPRPPLIPNACVEDTGEWRRYYNVIPATLVSDWLAVVPTMEIHTNTSIVRQARLRIYPNPDGLPAADVPKDSWISEQIISYIPANTVLTLDGVTQRVWAEVAGGPTQDADHLLYGSGGGPATWPLLSCGISYLMSVDLPSDVPAGDARLFGYLTTRS